QEARQQLDAVGEAGAYDYLYAELRGDLAMAEGDTARAARAYRQAMDSMPTQAPNAALLTAKYENVAGAAGSPR
ncbi:MAG: tetratricopeptide repeat protein, partial [Gammaproteobacteria bacterium]